MSSHTPIRWMGGLILGVNTLCRLFCSFKFPIHVHLRIWSVKGYLYLLCSEKGPSPGVAEGGLLRSYYSGGLPRMVRTTTPPSSGDGYYEQQGGYGGGEGSYGGTGGGGEGGYGGYGTMGEQGGYAGGGRYGRTQQAYGQYGTRQAFRSSRDGYAGTQQKTSGGGHSGVYPGTGSAGQGSDPDGYPTCQTAYVYGPSGGVGGGTYQASYGYGGTQGTYDGYRTGGRQSSSETKKTRSQSVRYLC